MGLLNACMLALLSPQLELSLQGVSQGHLCLLLLEQPPFSLPSGKKTIMAGRTERESGADQVKLLFLTEKRDGQDEVVSLAQVME